MTFKPPSARGAAFDLQRICNELRQEAAYDGHAARTLVRQPDLRVVVVAMSAGASMAEHQVKNAAVMQVVSGRLHVRFSDHVVELSSGHLLVFEPEQRHDVEADADSAFVLTLGWGGEG